MGIIKVNYKGKEYQAEQGKRAIEILKEAERKRPLSCRFN